MPTVLRKGPHRFFFFSNEGQEPPHIHVEAGDAYAKFWLQPVRLAHATGYNAVALRRLHGLVREHANLFLEKWREHFRDR